MKKLLCSESHFEKGTQFFNIDKGKAVPLQALPDLE